MTDEKLKKHSESPERIAARYEKAKSKGNTEVAKEAVEGLKESNKGYEKLVGDAIKRMKNAKGTTQDRKSKVDSNLLNQAVQNAQNSTNNQASEDEVRDLKKKIRKLEKQKDKEDDKDKSIEYTRSKSTRDLWKKEAKHDKKYSTLGVEFLYGYIYFVLLLDLFLFNYSTVLGLGGRFFLYLVIPFLVYFIFTNDGPLYALRTYGAISLFHWFVGPIIFFILQYIPVPGWLEANINLAVVLFPPWILYLQSRGIYWHKYVKEEKLSDEQYKKHKKESEEALSLGEYFFHPSHWPGMLYTFLGVILILNLSFTLSGMQALESIESDGIDPTETIKAFLNLIGGTLEEFWNNVVVSTTNAVFGEGTAGEADLTTEYDQNPSFTDRFLISMGLKEPPKEEEEDLGSSYRSQVENNLFGVEVDLEIQSRDREFNIDEGMSREMPVEITFDSLVQTSNATFNCYIANDTDVDSAEELAETEILYTQTYEQIPVGKQYNTRFSRTCEIPADLPPGDYSLYTEVSYPFTTQAITTYYFASSELFGSNPQQYDAEVKRLEANNVKSEYTAGGAVVATDSDESALTPSRPILLSPNQEKEFVYGFAVKPEDDGEIEEIQRAEMHVPQFLEVENCAVPDSSGREPRPGYTAHIVDIDKMRSSDSGDKYTFCNLRYLGSGSSDAYKFFVPSENRINDVTLSVYVDYVYRLHDSLDIEVAEVEDVQGSGTAEDSDSEESAGDTDE